MKKSFSIITIFSSLCLSILLVVVSVFGATLYSVSVQNKLHIQFVQRIHAADKVILDLQKTTSLLETYRHGWDEESFAEYASSCDTLDSDIETFSQYCSDSSEAVNDLRRLRNFNNFQMVQLYNARGHMEQLFTLSSYTVQAFRLHVYEAQEMVQDDLILSSVEYEKATNQIRSRVFWLVGTLAVVAVVILIILLRTYLLAVSSIQKIDQHFRELSQGNWNIEDLHVNCWKEFSVLSTMINQLKHKIQAYIQELETKVQLETQLNQERLINEQQKSMLISARMSALRAQVNPHFLFNALNMIGMTAMVDTGESVMHMVEAVGSILRYSLYSNNLMTLLDDEVEIVQKYLYLQKCRFGEALTVEVQNELEGEDYKIPSMTIQPIVENCFKHGFGKKAKLHLKLFIALDGECIQISVTDNGIGFPPDSDYRKGNGIGLNNIRQRLELQFGTERQWLEIKSETGKYSTVTMHIPWKGETS